jgi:YfiH family protein
MPAMPEPAGWPRAAASPPLYLTSRLLGEAGLPHLFTTRHFPGVTSPRDPGSPFDQSAMALLRELGIAGGAAAFLRQVHGADVVTAERGGLAGRADVLTTGRPALPLAIFTADCLPVVLYDPANRRLAMAHAGWRGTAQSAAGAAAGALVSAGGRAEAFVGAIGPSIGPCCYEVDGPVIERFAAAFPREWPTWVTATGPGKWMLDLWRANEDQLRTAGLDPARIDNLRLCTACRGDLFFSYRRGRGQGRLVAVAAVPASLTMTPGRPAGSR